MQIPSATLVLPPAPSEASAINAPAQVSALVVGMSPAFSTSLSYQQAAFAAGMSMLNAVSAQHSQFITNMAACVMGVERLYGPQRVVCCRIERGCDGHGPGTK